MRATTKETFRAVTVGPFTAPAGSIDKSDRYAREFVVRMLRNDDDTECYPEVITEVAEVTWEDWLHAESGPCAPTSSLTPREFSTDNPLWEVGIVERLLRGDDVADSEMIEFVRSGFAYARYEASQREECDDVACEQCGKAKGTGAWYADREPYAEGMWVCDACYEIAQRRHDDVRATTPAGDVTTCDVCGTWVQRPVEHDVGDGSIEMRCATCHARLLADAVIAERDGDDVVRDAQGNEVRDASDDGDDVRTRRDAERDVTGGAS